MFEKFESLADDKKKVILNSAMKEFVKGGYNKGSMNNVVENANISKGSLFYYFGNKKKLYLYLFEYCQNLTIENAYKHINCGETDFIRRMDHVIRCNVSLLKEYPLIYGFIRSCKQEKNENVTSEISLLITKSTETLFSGIYKNIDVSLFRKELDVNIATYSIKVTMFQIVHDAMASVEPDFEEVLVRVAECSKFFRTALYKK